MKKILYYLKDYLKSEFKFWYFVSIALFLGLAIFFNYKYNFESAILDSYKHTGLHFVFSFFYYGIPYYFAAIVYVLFNKQANYLKSAKFWFISLLGLSMITFSECFYWHRIFLENTITDFYEMWFVRKCLNNIVSFVLYMIPIYIFWYVFHKKEMLFYGINKGAFEAKPYLIMVLIMAPLITWASFQPDFLQAYPVYTDFNLHNKWQISELYTISIFEFCYGLAFVTVELYFRGFLIMALADTMGKAVIMPMVCMYCVYHFGKPMAEAISSIFGGAVLGILAYNTRSIYGGICVHLAVAFGMELAAFLQKI